MKVRALYCLVVLTLLVAPAFADSYNVYVGYADTLRSNPNFPAIWDGDSGVTFVGSGSPWDAGAIMIQNTGSSSLTVNDILVTIGSNTFDLWGSNTIAAGAYLVVTQTTQYNFDTSDFGNGGCTIGGNIPTVAVTTGGGSPTSVTYTDSGRVLNTGGFDLANCGANEALGWRLIGTTDITNPGNQLAPEPGTLVLLGTGLLGIGSKAWKRFIG